MVQVTSAVTLAVWPGATVAGEAEALVVKVGSTVVAVTPTLAAALFQWSCLAQPVEKTPTLTR